MKRVGWVSFLGWLSCALVLTPTAGESQTRDLTVAVLVNPTSTAGFGEYRHYPERYLEHLQIPYETINVAITGPASTLGSRQLIVAGHRGLNLSPAWRTAIVNAVQGGTGFVNLDWDGNIGYQSHIQAIFGATGSVTGPSGSEIAVPAAVVADGTAPHFIAGLQARFLGMPAGQDLIYPLHDLTLTIDPTVLLDGQGTVIARVGPSPLILARDHQGSAGRAVHLGSYAYLKADRLGFLMGLDDLFWRSLVWAARKPFVLRGYPRLFAVQLDDTIEDWVSRARDMYDPGLTGPLNGDGTGGPWAVTAYVLTDRLPSGSPLRAQMNADVAAGRLQVSPHAFAGDNGPDMYYKVPQTPPPTDADWWGHLNGIQAWIEGAGGDDRVPSISKSMVPHWWVMGDNTGYDLWHALGFRYITLRQLPGFQEVDACCPDPAARIRARPFRLYELPPIGSVDDDYPLFYADRVTVNSRAGLPPQTFTLFATSVNQVNQPGGVHRADFAWPGSSGNVPAWDVAKSLNQLQRWTWRLWSSQAPVNFYTHDANNLVRSTPFDRRAVIQQGTAWLSQQGAFHVYMEELGAYVHARTGSRLERGSVTDTALSLTFSGDARDADGQPVTTGFYVFLDDDEGALRWVSGFADGTSLGLTLTGPALAVSPASLAFSTVVGDIPAARPLQITNAGYGLLQWTITHDAAWLEVTPAGGPAPTLALASVSTAGMAAGTYTAAITVTAPGQPGSPATIPVTLDLAPPPVPTVSQVSPPVGSTAGGDLVEIRGTGLGSSSVVRIGGTSAPVVSTQGLTSLVVATPPGRAGATSVTVTTGGGSTIAPDAFSYVPPDGTVLPHGHFKAERCRWVSLPELVEPGLPQTPEWPGASSGRRPGWSAPSKPGGLGLGCPTTPDGLAVP
jgi:hypothetical protein